MWAWDGRARKEKGTGGRQIVWKNCVCVSVAELCVKELCVCVTKLSDDVVCEGVVCDNVVGDKVCERVVSCGAIAAMPATQKPRQCHQVIHLPHKWDVDVTTCHACHTKATSTKCHSCVWKKDKEADVTHNNPHTKMWEINLIESYCIWCNHNSLYYFTSFCIILIYYNVVYHNLVYYVILFFIISSYILYYYVYYILFYHIISYHTILQYIVLYYFMLCYAMICYVLLCYSMLQLLFTLLHCIVWIYMQYSFALYEIIQYHILRSYIET